MMNLNAVASYLGAADYLAGEQGGQIRHELIGWANYALNGAIAQT